MSRLSRRFIESTGPRPGRASREERRVRTTHSFAAMMSFATRDAASGLSRGRTHATRRRWRSWNSWRFSATPNAERGRQRGASVQRLVAAPTAAGATTPRSGAVADSRRPLDLCPESRRPWPRSRSTGSHRRWGDPLQASRASGRRRGRRTAGRSHARVDQVPVRRSGAAFQASPTPRAAVRERVRRRTRDRRGYPRARPLAAHYLKGLATTLASQFEYVLHSENADVRTRSQFERPPLRRPPRCSR